MIIRFFEDDYDYPTRYLPRKRSEKVFTRDELVDNFWKAQKHFGHQPTSRQINYFGDCTLRNYQKEYGGWTKFLDSLGLKPEKKGEIFSREELTEAFWECHKKLGRQPFLKDMDIPGKMRHYYYLREYGSWTKFLESQGLKTLQSPPKKKVNKEELIEAFWECHRLLGHQPSVKEMDQHGKYKNAYYRDVFSTWTEFLESIGLETLERKRITDEELDAEYDRVKALIGRIPKLKDMKELGKYSTDIFKNRFVYFDSYRRKRGDVLFPNLKMTKEELVAEYKNVKKKLGRVPSLKELKLHGSYDYRWRFKYYFKGYRAFLKQRRQGTVTSAKRKELIVKVTKEFYRVKKELGRIPTGMEFQTMSKYYPSSVIPSFLSWNNYVRSLGETPYGRGGGWQLIPGRDTYKGKSKKKKMEEK